MNFVGPVRTLILVAGLCSAQIAQSTGSPPQHVEIKLSPGIASESIFIRYLLAGEDFGGWVRARPGVSSYFISTSHEGRPPARIKAILYAPGCAIQTLDIPVVGSTNQQYLFACRPLPSIEIAGVLTGTHRLYGHELEVRAKYVARWAEKFLGIAAGMITSVPVGNVTDVSPEGRFRLSVPDFSQDPWAGAPDHPGEIQIWAKDKTSEEILAQLIPAGRQVTKTPMGGFRIQNEYPTQTVFLPCATNPPHLHGAFGFSVRPDSSDACER